MRAPASSIVSFAHLLVRGLVSHLDEMRIPGARRELAYYLNEWSLNRAQEGLESLL
jgi:hypothetical protein